MGGLRKQVVERFKFAWRMQPGDVGAPARKDQEARHRSDGVLGWASMHWPRLEYLPNHKCVGK
jgi:hypothetical protein